MDKEELKGLQFVLRYYSPGVFDTRKAIRRYKETHPVKERTWLRYISGIAASVAVCLFTAYYLIGEKKSPVCLYSYADATTFILPDSSEVTLFPNSTLSYLPDKFNKNKREVDMTGRIGFDVRRNRHTPFIVSGKYAKIKVLGTQFEVNENNDDSVTEIHVSSGKVLFSSQNDKNGIVLTKNMQAVLPFGSDTPLVKIQNSDKDHSDKFGRFVYENTPLSEVLKELSEHFHVKLTCVSTGKTLTAKFDTDNLDEIISMIEKTLDVKIRKEVVK